MILLEEKYILEYIKDILSTYKESTISIKDKYHHNSSYENALSILKYGILSVKDITKLNIHDYSKVLNSFENDDFHVNGNDGISLAIMGLQDLYRDEMEYDARNKELVDFLVSDDVEARRNTFNYGNEFVTFKPITLDKIKSLDIRILRLIQEGKFTNLNELNSLIAKFNYLKELASLIETSHLNIPMREMSEEGNTYLNINSLARMPKVKIK